MIGLRDVFPGLDCSVADVLRGSAEASPEIGFGELNRILSSHLPQIRIDSPPQDSLEQSFAMEDGAVLFRIPGFHTYGCAECHEGGEILNRAADRVRAVIGKLKRLQPEAGPVPLRQYIIQPWADELLQPRQFAHATFDTIRVFPRTILIDEKVYGQATHLHELLHLTQSFLGHANELEAYALNARSDPRFLLLNFPYFADVVNVFYVPDLKKILDAFFLRPVRENASVPREVQWYMDPYDPRALEEIRLAVEKMRTLLEEVGHLNRNFPLEAAYLSEQAGVPSLLLEIVAANRLSVPPAGVSDSVRDEAFAIFDRQMGNLDNTSLGRKVDRKQEAFLWMASQLQLKDSQKQLRLYFEYLKKRFAGPEGPSLRIADEADFRDFVERKLNEVVRMAESPSMTLLERQAATRFIEAIRALPGPALP